MFVDIGNISDAEFSKVSDLRAQVRALDVEAELCSRRAVELAEAKQKLFEQLKDLGVTFTDPTAPQLDTGLVKASVSKTAKLPRVAPHGKGNPKPKPDYEGDDGALNSAKLTKIEKVVLKQGPISVADVAAATGISRRRVREALSNAEGMLGATMTGKNRGAKYSLS